MGRRQRDGRAVREVRGTETLEAYRAFIDDWDAFQEAVRTPEPTTLRANVLRISRDALAEAMTAQGFTVEPVPHQPAFLKVLAGPRPVSDTLEHWSGLFYIQQRVTGWASPLLDPRPGERVLDLCSAPGGKSTHLAELMGGTGTVVAADVNESRIRALLGNIYRLGHANIMTVSGDGRHFPLGATFDRVMVDVPCSAEGTLRKRGGAIPGHSRKWAKQVTRAQEKILRRAVDLTRPGGTLLYVTCTFGPHENEGVLTRVLADTPLEVEALDLPVPHARGLTSFGEDRYDPRLEGAVRFYPHHLDSGGLFICRLRKPEEGDGDAAVGWTPVPRVFPGDEVTEAEVDSALDGAEAFLSQELGVAPGTLARIRWMQRGSNAWGHTLAGWPVEGWEPGGHWRAVAVGFRGLDLGGNGPPRPTNDLMAWLDGAVTAGRVELDAESWLTLLSEGHLTADAASKDGLVALCHRGMVLARGFQRDGVLRHEVPKGRLNWLRNVMQPTGRAFGSDGEES